jgi:protein NirF
VRVKTLLILCLGLLASACATPRGTGDLGVIIERAAGSVQVVETTTRTRLARITGLGDLSHASLVYSRDARHAYVFGRDGGLTKIDLLRGRIEKRIVQAGNAIGGAISQGRPSDRGFQLRAGWGEDIHRRHARAAGRHPGRLG